MGIHFCRDKPAHFQNTRRSCRSSYLCSLYGGFPAALRKIRRQDPAGSVHERKLHSLHPFLFMYFHPSISCAEPFGMCALRILRWELCGRDFSAPHPSLFHVAAQQCLPSLHLPEIWDVPVVRRLQVWYLPTPAVV